MLDWITAIVFLFIVGALATWILLKSFRAQLRQPPANYEKLVAISNIEDAPLPAKIRKPQVRRQLILGTRNPSLLNNLTEMSAAHLAIDVPIKKPLIYGFFHPNANAFGGGERVLWAAIKEIVASDQHAVAAIYISAEKGLNPEEVLVKVNERFGIGYTQKESDRIVFIALSQTSLVSPLTYPILTLLGQAIGQALLGYEAISNLMPDVFVDTSGLAFSFPIVSWFAKIPIVAYVHYPFVQAAMVNSLHARISKPKSVIKYIYYKCLTIAYKWAGSYADVVSVNSSWTSKYLNWPQPNRIIYPPCAVQEFTEPVLGERTPALVYLAQFRPEKRHDLVITEFAKVKAKAKKSNKIPKSHLILLGSVRNDIDAAYVLNLHALAKACGLTDNDYTIVENAPWENIKRILVTSSIGLNAMWNEHFGMGVVEIMAAGLIPVVNASGGPYMDIVKDDEGAPGFFFKSETDPDFSADEKFNSLADAMIEALSLNIDEQNELRKRCYKASQRFSDPVFFGEWRKEIDAAKKKQVKCAELRKKLNLFD